MLRFVQNDRVLVCSHGLENRGIRMRCEMRRARCEYFYHKVHGESVKWLCFWAHWGTSEMFWMCSEVVKLWRCDFEIFYWRDSSLCCAPFRMTRLYILLMIRNLFQWENCFWIAKIFFWIAFLSELSWRNSFAMKRRRNWCGIRGAS